MSDSRAAFILKSGEGRSIDLGGFSMAVKATHEATDGAAAMVGYFDEVAAAVKAGDVADDAPADIATRYGMDVIGPVPDGYV